MKTSRKILVLAAMIAVVTAVALTTQWFVARRAAAPGDGSPAAAAPQGALHGLSVAVLRSEVSAKGLAAVCRVTIQVRNGGTAPVRLGPGSFWLMDREGFPHLDRIAAEKPDAPPLVLEPERQSQEITMRFEMAASMLNGALVLLVGPAPTGQVRGSKPSPESLMVPVKGDGVPEGPFVDGVWKTYTGTVWK
jgi:hypothetical protein